MATRQGFDAPSTTQAVDKDGYLILTYVQWIARMTTIGQAAQQSGTTANRPTSVLWIGRQYYDTTLGYPVFVHSVGPPVVWHNAAGAVV